MPEGGALMRVSLVCAAQPQQCREWQLLVLPGCTVQQALAASPLLAELPKLSGLLDSGALALSIWGRQVGLHTSLQEHDRIELLRPLLVDPKVARRERFARQGGRAAGLFAKRRSGGKAGY